MYHSFNDIYALVRQCVEAYGREQVWNDLNSYHKSGQQQQSKPAQSQWTPHPNWRDSASTPGNLVLDLDDAHCVIFAHGAGWKGMIYLPNRRSGIPVEPLVDKRAVQQQVEAVLERMKVKR